MKLFVFILFLAGFAMEHMVVWSEYTCDGHDLLSLFNQLLTLKREFNDYKTMSERNNLKVARAIQMLNETQKNYTRNGNVIQELNETVQKTFSNINEELQAIQLNNEKTNASLIALILEQNKKLADLTRELQVLKDTPNNKDPAVAFIAIKSSENAKCNNYITFDNVLMNNGSGFDTRTNNDTRTDYYRQFIAPMSGIYLFSVQVCYNGNGTSGTNTNNVYIMLYSQTRNQKYGASHYQHNYESCSSMTTTAYLSTNDTIGVLCICSGDILQSQTRTYADSYWTMFTGALINT